MLPRYSGGTGQRAGTAFADTRFPFTDLPGDPEKSAAPIIDPVLETVRCALQRLGGLGLELRYVVEMDVHGGHIGGPAGLIRTCRPYGEAVTAAAMPGAAEKNPRGME